MTESEADTREEKINPQLIASGWKTGNDILVRREYPISRPTDKSGHHNYTKLSADYVLIYKNKKLGIVEAKKSSKSYTDGVAQAKEYASLLNVRFTYATNGKEIYQIDMATGTEQKIKTYPSPDELWRMTFQQDNELFKLLMSVPTNTDGRFFPRYYQENAVENVIKAISEGQKRILLTLATGTGKTCIAFQIVWKLFNAKWNVTKVGDRLPRILFLADRNILADQGYNSFTSFPADAMARIKPGTIKKNGRVPDAQSIFFTIFQTFMSGEEGQPYFGQYPHDFFDFIIIDECHRGGANDESNWRNILNYFDTAVQLGMTATPRRQDNVDTYKYFGDPVYVYSLKQGIADGYLTPFRVRDMTTDLEEYQYNPQDDIVIPEEKEFDLDKTYQSTDLDRKIWIDEREKARVQAVLNEIDPNEKTLIFCHSIERAGLVRDLVNQLSNSKNPNYCVRVTAEDGEQGETYLRQFQDTEKSIPTILTTSEKLSTGVDAIQIRNIVLLRPVNSIIEFKQIIGRGTRLCDGKDYFTIYDFVNASHNFEDPEWDGPIEYKGKAKEQKPTPPPKENPTKLPGVSEEPKSFLIQIKLSNGRMVEVYDNGTTFYDSDLGKPISAKDFIEKLLGVLPNFFASEEELRQIWSAPATRRDLLNQFAQNGFDTPEFDKIKKILNAESSDVFDVLEFLAYNTKMKTRSERAEQCQEKIADKFEDRQKAFIDFILSQYITNGVRELDDNRVSNLIELKYGTMADARKELGQDIRSIRDMFLMFQQFLYQDVA